jgi:DNA-binding NtrC family response regulator
MSRPGTRHPADVDDHSPRDNACVSCSRLPTGAPVAGEESSLPVIAVTSSEADRPIRLLVVDDDSRVRAAIAQTIALESDLVLVAEAADAAGALTLADHADPLVALVDVLLPDDVTGLALVVSLNRRPACAVVAMSVRGGLRQPAMDAGAVAFVEKGGDIDALLHAVRAAAAPLTV